MLASGFMNRVTGAMDRSVSPPTEGQPYGEPGASLRLYKGPADRRSGPPPLVAEIAGDQLRRGLAVARLQRSRAEAEAGR